MIDQTYYEAASMDAQAKKHSGLGITSFVLAILMATTALALVIVAGFMESQSPGGIDEESTAVVMLGLGIIASILLSMLACILGIVGMCQSSKKRLFAILGTCIGAITTTLTIGLIVIGLAAG